MDFHFEAEGLPVLIEIREITFDGQIIIDFNQNLTVPS